MTVQIALSTNSAAVLFSDSQASDEYSVVHGMQKQFAGPDFLLGIAGLGPLQSALFASLEASTQSGSNRLEAAGLTAFLERFIENEIRPEIRNQAEFIVVTPPDAGGAAVQTFYPGVFVHLGRRTRFDAIGSGAVFVNRAWSRYAQLGIDLPFDSLADLVVAVEDFARAANESLTVDDSFLLGVIANGKAYLMGDRRIQLSYAPSSLRQQWTEAATRFHDLMSAARAINGEMVVVQRWLSPIRTGSLTPAALNAIHNSNSSVITSRQSLIRQLQDYFAWYDGLLGRP